MVGGVVSNEKAVVLPVFLKGGVGGGTGMGVLRAQVSGAGEAHFVEK